MNQTLDDLEQLLSQPTKPRKNILKKISGFFKELKVLGFIFTVLFLGTYLVTNAQLVIDNVSDHFSAEEVEGISANDTHSSFTMDQELAEQKAQEVDALIETYGDKISKQQEIAPDMDHFLQHNLNSYEFSFNLLPPTNRLIIPAINLDVPLIETNIRNYDNFDEKTFDSDLENGVVKYPTTPNPGEGGNAFFFGHTSQEYWKKNPYGTVFRNIPQLKPDDKIQIVRNGVLYEYKVLDTVVVWPKDVNDSYVNFGEEGKEYITLMGCYPIGRTDKRMMVFAEKI